MRARLSRSPLRLAACVLGALLVTGGMAAARFAAGADEPSIRITRPHPDETLHDNTGAVPVVVALHGVGLAPDNRLRVLIDGAPDTAQPCGASTSLCSRA